MELLATLRDKKGEMKNGKELMDAARRNTQKVMEDFLTADESGQSCRTVSIK